MSDKNTTFITVVDLSDPSTINLSDLSDLSTIAPSDLPIVDLSEPEVTELEAMVLKWLNPRNRTQHLWAIDYLTTKGRYFLGACYPLLKIASPNGVNVSETHQPMSC